MQTRDHDLTDREIASIIEYCNWTLDRTRSADRRRRARRRIARLTRVLADRAARDAAAPAHQSSSPGPFRAQ